MIIKAMFSDPHVGHYNIIKYCDRPFNDVKEMNEALVNNYNSIISENDTVLWLGDCFFTNIDTSKEVMKKLNGHKILVLGNHDRSAQVMSGIGFDIVLEECFMTIANRSCRIKHYPYLDGEPADCRKDDRYKELRPPKVKGEVLLHGHTHSKIKRNKNMINISCDAWNYRPALYSEIEALVKEI